VELFIAFEDATSGSVIASDDRFSLESSGLSHRFLCSGVAKRSGVSLLPLSGI
jgi:hypothetical protein